MIYVEEFLYRGRDPVNEPGKDAAYHVVLAQFVTGPDDKQQVMRTPPMTPAQAVKAGFALERILGDIAASALLDRDAALAAADSAKEEKEVAQAEVAGARKEKADALAVAQEAFAQKDQASRIAADAVAEKQVLVEREARLLQEIAALKEPPVAEKPSLLSTMTLGLFGRK